MKTIILALLVVILATGCASSDAEKKEIIRKVKVTGVQKDEPVLRSEFSGTIKEDRENNLAFRVAGPILAVHVKEGSYVKKGDLIAEIDPRDYQIQLDVAQAQYNQVKAETDRVTEMYNRKSVASVDFDKAVSGAKLVTAQLKHAEDQLRDTKLFAPFSGYVQQINFEKGELINTGLPFATLISLGNYKIEVDIPASLFVRKNDFTSFTCRNHTTGDNELPLTLTSNSMKADNNQLYKLYFSLNPQLNKSMAPGMDVQVFIYSRNPLEESYKVPVEAVFYENGSSFVWVYDPAASVVKKTKVETGGLAGKGSVKIISGLSGNESVVVAGVNVLNDNQQVKVLEPVSETNVGGLL